MRFTLDEFCRTCDVARTEVVMLVQEGVLEPSGRGPQDWEFGGSSLRRARMAVRLARDLELGANGTALVLGLLDEIEALRSRLRRAGIR